jgi:tetraacyldisaccharide 4'-kinase
MRRGWLAPLTPLYAAGQALRNLWLGTRFEPVERLRWPVVSIGNLSTGGAGKTPLTIALARALTARGVRVDVLSRGYGRESTTAAHVTPDGTAEKFGDEPLLIAREAGVPVYVAARRFEAGMMAEKDASAALGVHLLDDGFQHRQLFRDIDVLLLDRRDLTDSLLPAGNLREPLSTLSRATVIAVREDEPEVEKYLLEALLIDRGSEGTRWTGRIWRLRRTMEVPLVDGLVVAFCGIARPEQFFAGLEAAGRRLSARIAFADHHRYSESDMKRLIAEASAKGATALITTEKDEVRLGKLAALVPKSLPLLTAGLRVEIENESDAVDWLMDRIGTAPSQRPL